MSTLQVNVTVIDLGGHVASRVLGATVRDQAYRDELATAYGTYRPGPDTTGVIPGIPRTTSTTAALTLVPGRVYQHIDFVTPYLNVPAGTAPIVFRNCRFLGPVAGATSSNALLRAWTPAGHAPVELYDCTIDPQTPDSQVNGIMGFGFKAHRCDISNVVDGFSGFNTTAPAGASGVEIYGSWIHDHAWWPNPPDTSHADGSHADGGQIQGGAGYVLRGNNFEGWIGERYGLRNGFRHISQCLMIKPDVGAITGLDIRENWFSGGERGINFANDAPDRMLGNVGTVSGNRFSRDQKTGITISMPSNAVCTTVGNVYEDGTPVTVKRNG